MNYTLWRGNTQIGELVIRFPSNTEDGIGGILLPTAGQPALQALVQHHIPQFDPETETFSQGPLLETLTPPSTKTVNPSGSYPLVPLTPEQLRGIPADQRLSLRDPSGKIVETQAIWLSTMDVRVGSGPFPDACRKYGIEGTAWTVAASFSRF